jgi:hypothetical protein
MRHRYGYYGYGYRRGRWGPRWPFWMVGWGIFFLITNISRWWNQGMMHMPQPTAPAAPPALPSLTLPSLPMGFAGVIGVALIVGGIVLLITLPRHKDTLPEQPLTGPDADHPTV